jgi:hypothetical protein
MPKVRKGERRNPQNIPRTKPTCFAELRPMMQKAFLLWFEEGYSKYKALRECGYAESTAKNRPGAVFDHPIIVAEAEKRRAGVEKVYEINRDWVIKGLKQIGDANPGAILAKLRDNGYNLHCLTDEEKLFVTEIKDETYMKGRGEDAVPVTKTAVKGVSTADRKGAFDSGARILGMNNDKLELGRRNDRWLSTASQ